MIQRAEGYYLNNSQTPLPSKQKKSDNYPYLRSEPDEFRRDVKDTGVENSSYQEPIGNVDSTAMDDEIFQATLRSAFADSQLYVDGWLGPTRAKQTEYYQGLPLGNEEEGRSKFVMTEVQQTVLAILPSIMRIFVSSENVVEFVPSNESTVDLALQQTDYTNFVFMEDNPGTHNLYQCFKDALLHGIGIMKWRWSEDKTVRRFPFSGLTIEQVTILYQDPTITNLTATEDPLLEPTDPTTLQPNPQTYSGTYHRDVPKNRVAIECVPPWEFLISRNARTIEGATFIAHRSIRYVSDLVAMGYDKDEIMEHMGSGQGILATNFEEQVTNPAIMSYGSFTTPDPAMRPLLFIEAYLRVDKDGDGFAELHKIHAIGENCYILDDTVTDSIPFSMFCPNPTPHTAIGEGVASQTMDIQFIKSNMVRAMSDSLSSSVFPRTVVVENGCGPTTLEDVMNQEPGAIIRVRQAGTVTEFAKQFNGGQTLPVLSYFDLIKAQRTGISDASQGLDPNVLQGSSTEGVVATITGAQERIELYARLFAEQGMKPMFKGIATLLCQNQDAPRTLKLTGKWTTVDPRSWIDDLEVTVNVALGKGTEQDKLKVMAMVIQKQADIMTQAGPSNPIVTPVEFSAALRQTLNLAGIKNSTKYFKDVTPQDMQQLQAQQAQHQPPPDPQMIAAQVAVAQQQATAQLAREKFEWEKMKDIAESQFEREKELLDAYVKLATAMAAHGQKVDEAAWNALVEHQNNVASQQIQTMQAGLAHVQAQSPQQNPGSINNPQ